MFYGLSADIPINFDGNNRPLAIGPMLIWSSCDTDEILGFALERKMENLLLLNVFG